MIAEDDAGAVALEEWAVTCDALARGEQIMLLREERLGEEGSGQAALPRESFWLYPSREGQDQVEVADPYRDRIRALNALDRGDGRCRLQYAASAEHVERIADRDRLMALDGQHTLNRSAVQRRLERAGPEGLLFAVLRVYERETAVVIEESREMRSRAGWRRIPVGEGGEAALDRSTLERELEPVVGNDRFLERKTELLQISGSMQAM